MGLRTFVKQLSQTWFPPAVPGAWLWSGSPVPGVPHLTADYGLTSSVLMGCVFWLARAWPEADLVVRQRKRGQDEWAVVEGHPLPELLLQPNAYYSGEALWMATVWSWCLFGNVYWRVVATRGGVPQQLWWVPPWQITPAWPSDGSEFISHYEYRPDGGALQRLAIEQVVHFRHGLDPRNPRLGLSPVASVLREMAMDEEASRWIHALLHNMAVPGLIISPAGDAMISESEAEAVRQYVQGRFTGDHRGEPMTLGAPTKVERLGFPPNQMDLTPARNTVEERVCAMFGLPPAVVGFGTGLETTKVGATMTQMVGLAWSNALIPPQRTMAGELQRTLLPRFERPGLESDDLAQRRLARLEVVFDYSRVSALAEDVNAAADRWSRMVQAGWAKVSEARAAAGLPVEPEDEIYLRSNTVSPVDPADQLPEPEPTPVPRLSRLPQATDDADDDEEDAPAEAAGVSDMDVKQGELSTIIQTMLSRRQTRVDTLPRQMRQMAARLDRDQIALRTHGAALLEPVLHRMGVRMSAVARNVLQPKQALQDLIAANVIVEEAPMAQIRADLNDVYQELYDAIAASIIATLGTLLVRETVSVSDVYPAMRTAAMERVREMDLATQFRVSLLKVFDQAHQEEWTEDQIIDAIQVMLPAGRFQNAATRASIIAATESRYGSNVGIAAWAQRAGLAHLLMVDARLGPTDAACEWANGQIITVEEAKILAGLEHPNGTRGFLPVSAEMLTELGVAG